MTDEQVFQAPDFLVPITAWRFWKIKVTPVRRRIRLSSLLDLWGVGSWAPGKDYEARCIAKGYCCGDTRHHHQDVPALPPGQCGIYGYKTVEEAFLDFRGKLQEGNRPFYEADGGVLGKVKLWGTIQEHQHGYRAQFAYPDSLVMGICDQCTNPFPVDEIPFLTQKKSNPSARFSVPVVARCSWHSKRDLEKLPGALDSLAKLYKITTGEKTLIP